MIPHQGPRVLVVVPNKNGTAQLSYSIPSLLATIHDHFEILVVDDHSTDDSLSRLHRDFPSVRTEVNGRSPGFAGAVNSGVEYAVRNGFDLVAVTNSDIEVCPQWLSLALDGAPQRALIGFRELPLRPGEPHDKNAIPSKAKFQSVSGFPGCLYLCPIDIFRTVGLYDESYFMYGEDNDFFSRLRRYGYQLAQSDVPVWHFGEASSQNAKPLVTWLAYRNAIRYSIKNESSTGIVRMVASLLNQGCNPFLRPEFHSPNYKRLRRFPIPINFFIWVGSILWNILYLPATLRARFSPPPTV